MFVSGLTRYTSPSRVGCHLACRARLHSRDGRSARLWMNAYGEQLWREFKFRVRVRYLAKAGVSMRPDKHK